MHPRLHRSLRIRLAQGQQRALRFLEEIFQGVIGVGLVSGNPCSFRQIEVIPLHGTCIAVATGGQEKLNGLALFGNHQMQLETVKEAPFASLTTSPHFSTVSFRADDAVIIAGSDRKAIDDVDRVFVQAFPGLAQHRKQGQKRCKRRLKRLLESMFGIYP
jgi:hypothetical protein